jgi:secreted trypsin-like serine protease
MKKKLVITLFSTVLVLILIISGVQAITFGQPDNGEHPYVGTLLFVQNGVGYYSCTGTLLSPTVMLTAGHCVEEAGNVNDVTYVRFAENAMSDYGSYGSTQEWLDNEWVLAASVVPHPQYNDFATFPLTYDVGIVILSEPVNMNTYGVLPEAGFLEQFTHGQEHNASFTAVGYGRQGVINPFAGNDYARYKGTVTLIELNSTNSGGASAKFSNNPGGGNGSGGTCFGDSGGPIFLGNTNLIVAVTSFGITPCIGNGYEFRMDTDYARGFLSGYANVP